MKSSSVERQMGPIDVDFMMDRFVTACRERGFSVTPQRLALYRALLGNRGHPTPEMLFAEVREQMPTLSLATVYKAIDTFKEMDLIRELRVPEDHRMRLDADMRRHHHLVCVRCREVMDLHLDLAGDLSFPPDSVSGFEVHSFTVQLSGVCSECKSD